MTDAISFSDFQKLDVRIGTVIEAVVPDGIRVKKLQGEDIDVSF